MKNEVLFRSYSGDEPFIFLSFDKADREIASGIINNLIERQFRICYDEHDNKTVADCEWLADRILSSALVIFLISSDSLASLELRNCINYALSKKKNIFCIQLDDKKLDYGFDLQLSTVQIVKLSNYTNAAELCGDIVKSNSFNQDMRGEDAKTPVKKNRFKTAAITALVTILVMLFVAAALITVYRITYDNSIAGQIQKLTETDYLDISNNKASMINLLKGKTIKTLLVRNMGLTDIEALAYVNCEELDISQNPGIMTLEPLLRNKNLKTLTVSQDIYLAIARLTGRNQFKIFIMQ